MFCPFTDSTNAYVLENMSRHTQPSASQLVPSVVAAVRSVKQTIVAPSKFSLNVSSLLKEIPALASVDETRSRSILPDEERDVNKPGFSPAPAVGNNSTSQWINSLSENEFYALAAAVVVGPLIASFGLTTLFKKYQQHKLMKLAAHSAKSYLRRCATFNPVHFRSLMPVVPPLSPGTDPTEAVHVPYPYLQEPRSLPGNINNNNWRNTDVAAVQRSLDRVGRMSEDELIFFHTIFTRYAHMPEMRQTIEKTVQWILTGQVTIDDARACTVPQAAVNDLPQEQRRQLKAEGWETRFVHGEEAERLRQKMEAAKKKEQEIKEQDALKSMVDRGDGPKPVQ